MTISAPNTHPTQTGDIGPPAASLSPAPPPALPATDDQLGTTSRITTPDELGAIADPITRREAAFAFVAGSYVGVCQEHALPEARILDRPLMPLAAQ